MKNREKYRDEILKCAVNPGRDICEFRRKEVFPHFAKKDCNRINCSWCSSLAALWLDEEYVEQQKPEVDWSKVPVDTLVRVRDNDDEEWVLQYFKGIDENRETLKYMAWSYGATSATAQGNSTHWQYCELVEEAEDK